MYQAFDQFLAQDWQTGAVQDDRRFFDALLDVIRERGFSIEAMADYFRSHESYVPDELGQFEQAIERRITQAKVMQDYLLAMNL